MATALLLAVPANVFAAEYRGRTSQGRGVLMHFSEQNQVELLRWRWAARCDRPGYSIVTRTTSRPPFDLNSGGRWADYGRYAYRAGDQRISVAVRASGARSGNVWAGRLTIFATARKNGRVFTRCAARGIRWRVAMG